MNKYYHSLTRVLSHKCLSKFKKISTCAKSFYGKETKRMEFDKTDKKCFGLKNCRRLHNIGLQSRTTLNRPCYQCSSIHNGRPQTQSFSIQSSPTLHGEVDRYQGIWIDLRQLSTSISDDQFDALLKASLLYWKEKGLETVWLQASMTQGGYMATAACHGFNFHHAEGKEATLFLGLDPSRENRVPMFASHQIGVSGVVIKEETKEVLVVQDKGRRFTLWKFPGGLSDLGEDIAKTAEREVSEETGLKTEFKSILAFRQQHDQPGAFGRSDLYILCRLKPLTFDLNPCIEEISACQWMKVEKLKKEVHASSITHRMAELIDFGLRDGWDKVDICPTKMESIYKGKMFHMFNRPIS